MTVDDLPEAERQRLYQLAAVRGYRIQTLPNPSHYYLVRLGHQCPNGRTAATRIDRKSYPKKKDARRALLELMLDHTQRRIA